MLALPAAEGDEDRRDDSGLVHLVRLPARPPRAVPIPDDLPEVLRSRLQVQGVESLWRHQHDTLAIARTGQHAIVATATASGKTLAYLLPVLERLVGDDRATALYLAPTKALARDQLRVMRAFRLAQVRAAAIDGDTPKEEREAVRRTANVVLTNPDFLHHALLPDHRRWTDFLHRLEFVVVDEAHVARGVFGGHVALILRRLRRLAEHYGADPTWLLATATVGNPAEHARALTGLHVEAVVSDGAPRGPFDLGVWQPGLDDDGQRRSTIRQAASLLASFVAADVQTLVFTRSRKAAEVVALIAKERLDGASGTDGAPLSRGIAAYRAGYLAHERRELEERLRSGELVGVAATDALELGIDVSGLDAVVLAGWPGTTASFWQRMGRAGRAGGAAAGVLVAQDDPLDQYFVDHPDELVSRPAEDAVVDPSNPYLLAPHLRCAAHEIPITLDEANAVFGPQAASLLAADVDDEVLKLRSGRHHWVSRRRPSADVELRSAGGRRIRIVDTATGAVIGDVDEPRAHRQVHTGAVYLHQGRHLRVDRLDLDEAVALVDELIDTSTTTRPTTDTDIRVVEALSRSDHTGLHVTLCGVEVTTRVTGYDVISLADNQTADHVELDLPALELATIACSYAVDDDVLAAAGIDDHNAPGALHAAEHAAIGMLPLIALCDRWDLGGLSTRRHPDTGEATVFVYDAYPGGAGLAERAHQRFSEHQQVTRDRIAGCPCAGGCPSCVQSPKCGNGNDPLDKAAALRLLDVVLQRYHS